MKTKPLISIIIPVYNVAEYLRECVDSVLSQSYHNIEVILVDDGSTDSCGAICDQIAREDSRVKVIHKSNGGLSSARNAGLDIASGEYISFIDSDDIISPQYTSTLLDDLIECDCDISSVTMVRFQTAVNFQSRDIKQQSVVMTGKEAVEKILYQDTLDNSASAKLFKACLFSETRFPEGIYYEDLATIPLIYHRCHRVVHRHIPLYFYRDREDSILGSFNLKRTDALDVTDVLTEHFACDHKLLSAARDRKFSANMNILWLMSASGIEDYDTISRCWLNIKALRTTSLFNPRVRLKNKLGAMATFGGLRLLRLILRQFK